MGSIGVEFSQAHIKCNLGVRSQGLFGFSLFDLHGFSNIGNIKTIFFKNPFAIKLAKGFFVRSQGLSMLPILLTIIVFDTLG
jgi:hypothetical protein